MREAIENCGTDFELGDLTIEGAGCDALAEQLEAVHLRLDQAAAMIAAPLFPDLSAKPFHRAERLVAGIDAGPILDPWLAIAAYGNDRVRTPRGDRGTAFLGVVGTITTDDGDPLAGRDLRQQTRQCCRVNAALYSRQFVVRYFGVVGFGIPATYAAGPDRGAPAAVTQQSPKKAMAGTVVPGGNPWPAYSKIWVQSLLAVRAD